MVRSAGNRRDNATHPADVAVNVHHPPAVHSGLQLPRSVQRPQQLQSILARASIDTSLISSSSAPYQYQRQEAMRMRRRIQAVVGTGNSDSVQNQVGTFLFIEFRMEIFERI